MRRILALFLVLCLFLGGCEEQPAAAPYEMPAEELLHLPAYSMTAAHLPGDITSVELSCLTGDAFWFFAQVAAEEGAAPNRSLFRLPLAEGADAQNLWTVARHGESSDSYPHVAALFPGEDGQLWVMSSVTRYIFDLPRDFDETRQDKWDYYQHRGTSVTFRRFHADGQILDSFTLTDVPAVYDTAAYAGGLLYCAAGSTVHVLHPDGTAAATLQAPAGIRRIFAAEERIWFLTQGEDGRPGSLCTIDSETMTFGSGIELPTAELIPCTVKDGRLLYTVRGDLFARSLADGSSEKLLDWQFLNRNRSYISDFCLNGSRAAALYRTAEGETPELLLLSPAEAHLTQPPRLILGAVCADASLTDLVLQFNLRNHGGTVAVADYSDFDAMGQSGIGRLRQDLAAGRMPDLLFSADAALPLTELAPHMLQDLRPYMEADGALADQGLMTAVFTALREEDGTLPVITPYFRLSTAIARGESVMPLPIPVSRAVLLARSMTEEGSVMSRRVSRADALAAHLSRCGSLYLTDDGITLHAEQFAAALRFAALFPETADWSTDLPEDRFSVRQGTQLLMGGTYGSFRDLARDMSTVGESAVLCGWPDTPGSHALEVQQTYGMTLACRDGALGWMFLRQVLLDEQQEKLALPGFPTNRTTFRRMGRAAMNRGAVTMVPVDGLWVEISEDLTEARFAAIEEAADSALLLQRPMDADLSAAIFHAVSGYFADAQTADDAVIAAQTALNLFLHPENP